MWALFAEHEACETIFLARISSASIVTQPATWAGQVLRGVYAIMFAQEQKLEP